MVAGIEFSGYGAHTDHYPHVYVTVAAALGTTRGDVDALLPRLRACFKDYRKKQQRQQGGGVEGEGRGEGGGGEAVEGEREGEGAEGGGSR